MTPVGLHLHVGGYRRRGSLTPPTQGPAYHPPAALLYILRDVLADGEHEEPEAAVAWPEPLCRRPHAPTRIWLVITDDQCTRATEQAQLLGEWVIVQMGAGQPRTRGLPRGTALLVVRKVPHDPHMAVHALEDQPEDTGHLVVHERGGPAWLREHVTALRSWASTIAGADVRLQDHPAVRSGKTGALSMDQLTPSHPDVRLHSADLNAGWLRPTGYYWIPEAFRHPHGTQYQPAEAHAVGQVPGPHTHTNRTRDTQVAEPPLPNPGGGRPRERRRLTPDAPQNGGRPPPWGRPPTTAAARSPHKASKPRGQCWAPTSAHPRPQQVGGGLLKPAQKVGSQRRGSA